MLLSAKYISSLQKKKIHHSSAIFRDAVAANYFFLPSEKYTFPPLFLQFRIGSVTKRILALMAAAAVAPSALNSHGRLPASTTYPLLQQGLPWPWLITAEHKLDCKV